MKAWFAAAVGADVTLGTDAANAEEDFFYVRGMYAIASSFSPQPPSNTHTVLHLHDRGLPLR